jgi:hypothetical protein
MKHIFKSSVILIIFLITISCETDEICLEDTTPHLIVRFYNQNIPDELKSVLNLKVNIEGIEGEYDNETIKVFTDSISIPLMVTENKTRFIFTLPGDEEEGTKDNLDTITLIYTQEDIFVSRSCGYKAVYHNAKVTLTQDGDNWIKFLEPTADPLEIIDENLAHVKIYH